MMVRINKLLMVSALIAMGTVFLYACHSPATENAEAVSTGTSLVVIPTWTALPSDRVQGGVPGEPAATPTRAVQVVRSATPADAAVTVKVLAGNLYIRRGPSVDYNPIGFIAAGQSANAIGRDRVRRWVFIESPGEGSPAGWVSTLTEFTQVDGDLDRLPLVTVEPAQPAFIRNCTQHTMWIMPAQVQLLPKANGPYNEERFPPGEYLVYDLDVSDDISIQEIGLREGLQVEIRVDGNGEKSKCY